MLSSYGATATATACEPELSEDDKHIILEKAEYQLVMLRSIQDDLEQADKALSEAIEVMKNQIDGE